MREYAKKKEKKSGESLTQRIVRHRFAIFSRIVLILAVVAAVAALVFIQIKNRNYESYEVINTVEKPEALDSTTVEFAGNILNYSRDGASCSDAKGTVLWNQTFEMQNPIMRMAGDKVAFGDYNGSSIYLMDQSKSINKIDTKMPIRNFCVSSNGMIAAVLDDGNVIWIYVFSSSGEEVAYFKVTMKKSGYPIAVGISPKGTLVQVSFLSVQNGTMDSKVAFYNFDAVGQNKIDNLVSAYDYPDMIVPIVGFLDDDTSFGVADNRLMIYSGGQIPTSTVETLLSEEIQSVYYNNQYIGLVYYDATGEETYRLDIYDHTGKLKDSKKFSMDFTQMTFYEDRVIISNEMECLIHSIGGTDIFSGQFDKSAVAVIPTKAPQKYIMVTSDSIDTIQLK